MPDLEEVMTEEEREKCGVARLSATEREHLARWGFRMFGLGQHVVSEIDKVKYGGKLVVLNDGSRWEVDDINSGTASLWSDLDKVVVIDGEMYNIESCEKVDVRQDDG